jgi:hypothetical protein
MCPFLTRRHRGGVRGIVELEVLKLIAAEFDYGINVQSFFDLIVGTRYVSHVAICCSLVLINAFQHWRYNRAWYDSTKLDCPKVCRGIREILSRCVRDSQRHGHSHGFTHYRSLQPFQV